MTKFFKGNAVTVGQLRAALANIPDDFEVGQACVDLNGHVEKTVGVYTVDEGGILVFSASQHAGSFTDDELDEEAFLKVV